MAVRSFSVHEAKTNLSRLLEAVERGHEVVITRGKTPVARLVRFAQPKVERRFGAMRGRAKVTDDFFAPLPEEELAAWE
ncbi:MAG: type II toxin-antitoxin system Phd/YefM family antitoxin [Polyangiaceae bacterium]|nr:type II toxin-antitoxin system Phd/YefM family antitoxin [Polyangiaceae bacterium]MCW5790275.1 type II toxin-antitoxin system Phd/YefM family antitoxin [Polyangiaceae bacterium]